MAKRSRQRSLAGFEDFAEGGPEPETPQKAAAEATAARSTSKPRSSPQKDASLASEKPKSLENRTVYVIDSHSLIYQVFHAMPNMTSPTGQPIGAVQGFIRDILDILERKKPDYLFCAFDSPGDTFRHDLYRAYKEKRSTMPEDLRPQMPNIRRMLDAMRVSSLESPRYEADDILATIARQVDDLGGECYLVTGDKDCRQLITQRVKMYNIRKDEVFDAASVEEAWGIRPDQAVDFQALVGDSVDNIPGVPLIGPKIAKELLQKYETLENVLDHAGELSGKKRRENLMNGREQALLSRKLVRLVDETPVEIDWGGGLVGGFDQEEVQALCSEFGFRRLAERMGESNLKDAPQEWSADYQTITSESELKELAASLARQKRVSMDTETTSVNPRWAEIVGYSFSWREGLAYYIPVKAPPGDPRLDPRATLLALRPILENPAIEKVGQNLKYDMVVLRSAGVVVQGAAFDTMVADYLLDPGERSHGLDDLAKRYLHHTTTKISELIGTGKKQIRMDEVPVEQVSPYAAEDADIPLRLSSLLERRLHEEGLHRLFADLEMPLIEVLCEMEFNGVKIDVPRLAELSKKLGDQIKALEEEIFKIAGHEFNIDSRIQLSKVLFEELELPIVKKTKTGPSTDAEVLTQLARLHPLPAKIIEYRQNCKLKSTYVDALPQLVHPQTGRVHTSFMQDVAATGRLSSKNPNLQNIPIRTEQGREIRAAFVPENDSWRLLTADYSQIELRVLAHFSGDEALLRAFDEDQDIHALVASQVCKTPLNEVTPEMRRQAKAVNFGVIYGQSAFGLAKSLDIGQEEAAQFIETYFEQYAGVTEFMEKILEDCRKNGYVNTILGRRRAIQGVRDSSARGDSLQKNLPERIAINTVIQGSAADLIKQAMLQVHRRLQHEQLQARMLLQIHDELMFESPLDELPLLTALVEEEMTTAGKLAVPLTVDIKSGVNWAQCEPYS